MELIKSELSYLNHDLRAVWEKGPKDGIIEYMALLLLFRLILSAFILIVYILVFPGTLMGIQDFFQARMQRNWQKGKEEECGKLMKMNV